LSEALVTRGSFRAAVAQALPPTQDPIAVWRSLGEAGVLERLFESNADSASSPDRTSLDELLAELDAKLPLGVVLSVCVQVASALPLLADLSARSVFAADVLSEALAGDAVVALAVTDAAAPGSDLLRAQTVLREKDGGSVLEGEKRWIANAEYCRYALVLARHQPANHFTSFRWLLVPASASGVSREPATSEHFHGSGVGHLRFDAVRIESEALVGSAGRGLAQFFDHLATERLAGALWSRSLCRRIMRETHAFLSAGPRWKNAAIRERFARCLVELHSVDALCATAEPAGRRGATRGTKAMLIKVACAGSVERILTECVSLRGADAFRDGGEARSLAEASMFGIAGGATGALLAGIAEHADELLEAAA
jgi:acyl-CoA dehydrogenase